MKLKKKVKITLALVFVLLVAILGFLVYKNFFSQPKVKEAKVIGSIEDYGYTLKDNKNDTYKAMFNELKKILETNEVDYNQYASKISEMFIYDFYSLEDKVAKNDVGGVDFVHPDCLANFLENAESTYYKYVENDLYGNRSQSLPMVDKVTIGNIETTEYALGDENIDDAYKIELTWTYTNDLFSDYQNSAYIYLVRDGKKLQIVELN